MARARRKQRKIEAAFEPRVLPTPEQLKSGEFVDDFITQVDSNTKAKAFRRTSLVERWMQEDPKTFNEPARRVIGDCLLLWAKLGEPRLIALYGERLAASSNGDGHTAHDAQRQLGDMKDALGPHMRQYWAVWENVLRFGASAGVAGSHFANNSAQRIQSAKVIVGMVANVLAGKMGY